MTYVSPSGNSPTKHDDGGGCAAVVFFIIVGLIVFGLLGLGSKAKGKDLTPNKNGSIHVLHECDGQRPSHVFPHTSSR